MLIPIMYNSNFTMQGMHQCHDPFIALLTVKLNLEVQYLMITTLSAGNVLHLTIHRLRLHLIIMGFFCILRSCDHLFIQRKINKKIGI